MTLKKTQKETRKKFALEVAAGIIIASLMIFLSPPLQGLRDWMIPSNRGTSDTTEPSDRTPETPSPTSPPTSPTPANTFSTTPSNIPSTDPSTPSTTPSSSTVNAPTTQWVYLSKVKKTEMVIENRPGGCTGGCTGFSSGKYNINGNIYSNSWNMRVGSTGASVTTWTVARACTSLKMTVGVDDGGQPGSIRFTYEPSEGEPQVLAEVSSGQSQEINLDITNVYSFKLGAVLLDGKPGDVNAILGDARVQCNTNQLP